MSHLQQRSLLGQAVVRDSCQESRRFEVQDMPIHTNPSTSNHCLLCYLSVPRPRGTAIYRNLKEMGQ